MGCGVGRTGVGLAEFSSIKIRRGREEGRTGLTCGLDERDVPADDSWVKIYNMK